MCSKGSHSYHFSMLSALYITVLCALFMIVFSFIFIDLRWFHILVCSMWIYVVCFFVLQYRVENVIYKNLKEAYKHIIGKKTDSRVRNSRGIEKLTDEIRKFVTTKEYEIEVLKTRDTYRREFIGNLSHELKTPLFTIQGYVETLLDGAMNDEKTLKKYLRRASKGAERLTYIINDLDLITKIELGGLELKHKVFDIIDLIEGIFELLEITASRKNITLSFDRTYSPVRVYADPESIRQMITNLIVNSIKYGKHNGTTEVSVENTKDEDKIIIRVSDNGEGIDQKYINRVFERFFRVEQSRSREEGGSGLGLAIVKHILEAHQQSININSVLGVGSEFSFTLDKANSVQIIQGQFNQLIK